MVKKQIPLFLAPCVVMLLAALVSCQSSGPRSPFAKTWRTVLDVPDGGLPFHIEIIEKDGKLHAVARNAEEVLPFTTVDVTGDSIKLTFEHYDCWFEGRPLVVCVIGTWCCNCYDAGRLFGN